MPIYEYACSACGHQFEEWQKITDKPVRTCPKCKAKVDLVKDGTALKCPQCHRVYPIKDDIPVMLIDEATIEP